MKTDIERFLKFIEEDIANEDYGWEYDDGNPMTQDAKAFLEEINRIRFILNLLPWDYEPKF